MKIVYIVTSLLVGLMIGFFLGRKEVSTKTEYVKMYPIQGFSEVPKSFLETIPEMPNFLYFTDTVTSEIKVDTAAIIRDWTTKREYELTLIDSPELGKLTIFPIVQYNELQPVRYEFLPVQKVVYKQPVWQPFVGASYSTFNEVSLGVGTFYHNLGIEASYVKDLTLKRDGYEFGIKYKF